MMRRTGFLLAPMLGLLLAACEPEKSVMTLTAECGGQPPDAAISACTRLLRSDTIEAPIRVRTLINRANARAAKGDYDAAIGDLSDSIKLAPEMASTFVLRGNALQAKGDSKQAVGDYNQAIRLDPTVTFLNHGSYGACPEPILAVQRALRDRLEAEPVRFMNDELPALLDEARAAVGGFVRADPEGLAFVSNATTGINAVLRSLHFEPGDELLTDDHEYNATINAMRAAAARDGAHVVVARIPFPIPGPDEARDAVLAAVTPRTRLVVISQVTSPTAVIFPVGELVAELDRRGIDTLVDGAHAPGMIPLDVDGLGAAYWTGNAHKWLCGPKGTAVLWVRADRRDGIHPLVTSHGANADLGGRSRFRHEFDWVGTSDPTGYLTLPAALAWMRRSSFTGQASRCGVSSASPSPARTFATTATAAMPVAAIAPRITSGNASAVPMAIATTPIPCSAVTSLPAPSCSSHSRRNHLIVGATATAV
jgi:isopenicillin-N epimerase